MEKKAFKNVDAYIAEFPPSVQELMRELRAIIKKYAPEATESISYQMPYYNYHGRLVYFGGFKNHISVFIISSRALKKYQKQLAPFQKTANTTHLPLNAPLPKELLTNIIKESVKERDEELQLKRRKRNDAQNYALFVV